MAEIESNYVEDLNDVINLIDTFCYLQTDPNIKTTVSVPYLQGKPGGGKTESIRAMAASHNDEYMSCHFALMQIEDLGGIPQFHNEIIRGTKTLSTVWSLPEFIANVYKNSDIASVRQHGGFYIKNKETGNIRVAVVKDQPKDLEIYKFDDKLEEIEKVSGDQKHHRLILLLDDMHRCDGYHMTALFEILTERKIHNYPIPKNVALVLAGNDSVKAGAKAMLSAIINRLAIMKVQTNFKYWKSNYALTHNIHPAIIAFLTTYTNYFHMEEKNDEPWSSPRAWTNFSNALSSIEKVTKRVPPKHIINYMTYGHLGSEIADKFTTFYTIFNEYPTEEIFKTVKTAKDFIKFMEKYDYAQQYSLTYACLNYFIQHYNEKNKNKFIEVIKSIITAYNSKDSKHAHAELGATVLKELYKIFECRKDKFNIFDILDSLTEIDANGEEHDTFVDITSQIINYQENGN